MITTNQALNLVDALAPVSAVSPIAAAADSVYQIRVLAQDEPGGSGVQAYDLYVSEDGQTYQPYQVGLTDSVVSFTARAGQRYAFFSIATDWVGNVEALKSVPEATIAGDFGACRPPEATDTLASGLLYAYYEGTWNNLPDFSTLEPVRTGVVPTFSLLPRAREEGFAFRYTGYLEVPNDGEYVFYVASDDGSRLYIGDSLVVDNDGAHSTQEVCGKICLRAGKHPITVAYFEGRVIEELTVSYSGPGLAKQVIPAARLFQPPASAPVARQSEFPGGEARGQGGSEEPMQVHPNPTSDQLSVRIPNPDQREVRVQIIDLLSRKVYEATRKLAEGTNRLTVSVGHLPSGTYMLHVQNGTRSEWKRIVITK